MAERTKEKKEKKVRKIKDQMNFPSFLLNLMYQYKSARDTNRPDPVQDQIGFILRALPTELKKRVKRRAHSDSVREHIDFELEEIKKEAEKMYPLQRASEKDIFHEEGEAIEHTTKTRYNRINRRKYFERHRNEAIIRACDDIFEKVIEEAEKAGLLYDMTTRYDDEIGF